MLRNALMLTVSALFAAGLLAAPAEAHTASPEVSNGRVTVETQQQAVHRGACVTRREYRRVHRGMKKARVRRIWDGRGTRRGAFHVYGFCSVHRFAYVRYGSNNRVIRKGQTSL